MLPRGAGLLMRCSRTAFASAGIPRLSSKPQPQMVSSLISPVRLGPRSLFTTPHLLTQYSTPLQDADVQNTHKKKFPSELSQRSPPPEKDSGISQKNFKHDDSFPKFSRPIVAKHLYTIAGLVFAVVVIGGWTRLTESGLSITEWNLVTGTLPPLSHDGWMAEFDKYRVTPEGRLLNHGIELSEFKKIYWMEYAHRLLGRVIGLAFILPIPIFIMGKKITPRITATMFGIGGLIGGQGFLGWYMVKSGLSDEVISSTHTSGVPRVSQYRLAAHLGLAFIVYLACIRTGMAITRDWKVINSIKSTLAQAKSSTSSSSSSSSLSGVLPWNTFKISGYLTTPPELIEKLNSPAVIKVRNLVTLLSGLAFLTALSGAFVAGLDAGLLYNTFPFMGHDPISDRPALSPPKSELFDKRYVRSSTTTPEKNPYTTTTSSNASKGQQQQQQQQQQEPHEVNVEKKFSNDQDDDHLTPSLIFYNMFENPTTVQFDHRVLAITTFFSTMFLFLYARRNPIKSNIPPTSYKLIKSTFHMAALQATLGISTLLYLVPVPLASAHQTGSLVLLSLCIAAGASLRRPHRSIRKLLTSLPR